MWMRNSVTPGRALKFQPALNKKNMDHKIRFKIAEVLKERSQSLYWLSRTTGISYTTLWRLTKDRALGMNFATLEKMCVALECTPGELIEIGTKEQEKQRSPKMPTRPIRRTSSLL
jgi:putative transcriptional regulator